MNSQDSLKEKEDLNLSDPETPTSLPSLPAAEPDNESSLEARVANYERGLIETALDTYQGNIAAAARSLNISRTTLNYKVQKYGIRFGVVHR